MKKIVWVGWVPQFSILKSSNLVEDEEIVSLPKKLICQGMRAEKDYHQSRSSKAFLASLQRTFTIQRGAGFSCRSVLPRHLLSLSLSFWSPNADLNHVPYPTIQTSCRGSHWQTQSSNLSSHLGPFTSSSYLCFVFIIFLYSLTHVSCICSPSPHFSLFLIS